MLPPGQQIDAEGWKRDYARANKDAHDTRKELEAYPGKLRAEFIRLMTEDSGSAVTHDLNQAIFNSPDSHWFPGSSIWSTTDLWMVLHKFDQAVKNLGAK